MKRDLSYTLIILAMVGLVWALILPTLLPVPHKNTSAAEPVPGAGTALVGPAAEVRAPYIIELQREIEAREKDCDTLSQQLSAANAYIQELSNTLNGAIAERNEAIALLQQLGALDQRPQL